MKNLIFLFLVLTNWIVAQTNDSINGIFFIDKTNYLDSLNAMTVNNGAAVYFSENAVVNINLDSLSKAAVVKFNEQNLSWDDDLKYYSGVGIEDLATKNWDISGQNSIPAMNFSYLGDLPDFNLGTLSLMDTLSLSDTLYITIGDIQKTDSVQILITDQSEQHRVALVSPYYTDKYYITPSALANLSTGPQASIKIEAINYSYQTISDKRYLFKSKFSYLKYNVVIVN